MGRAALFFLLSALIFAPACRAAEPGSLEIEAEGRYQMAGGVSVEKARRMAVFIARRNAVASAARYLARQHLIDLDEMQKNEIFSLAAGRIQARVLAEERLALGGAPAYRVRIRARVGVADFVASAEQNEALQRAEQGLPFAEEMEPSIEADIDPGRDISRLYRLMRERKWRPAMIYADDLLRKYPNWAEIYRNKAFLHYIFQQPEGMREALRRACRLDDNTACEDLERIRQVQDFDFGTGGGK